MALPLSVQHNTSDISQFSMLYNRPDISDELNIEGSLRFPPMKYEARILIIRLKKDNYTTSDIVKILTKLGFSMDESNVEDVWGLHLSKEEIKLRRLQVPQKEPIMTMDLEKIMQMTYLFLNNQEMTVNKASDLFLIGKQHVRRYMIQFGIGCSKGKSLKFTRYTFKGYGRKGMTAEEQEEWEEEERQRIANIVPLKEPNPIDPNSDPIMKKVEIRIIFPKIRYGQIHQWDRYYERLTREVKLKSVEWLDFKQGDKFSGKGCYIYVLTKYDQNVYPDNFALEKFLETNMAEDFFGGNCLSTNKIRVFDYPFVPSAIPEDDVINLKLSKAEICEKVEKKIKAMSETEQKQLLEIAQRIHKQYTTDVLEISKSRKRKARFQNFTKTTSSFCMKNDDDDEKFINIHSSEYVQKNNNAGNNESMAKLENQHMFNQNMSYTSKRESQFGQQSDMDDSEQKDGDEMYQDYEGKDYSNQQMQEGEEFELEEDIYQDSSQRRDQNTDRRQSLNKRKSKKLTTPEDLFPEN